MEQPTGLHCFFYHLIDCFPRPIFLPPPASQNGMQRGIQPVGMRKHALNLFNLFGLNASCKDWTNTLRLNCELLTTFFHHILPMQRKQRCSETGPMHQTDFLILSGRELKITVGCSILIANPVTSIITWESIEVCFWADSVELHDISNPFRTAMPFLNCFLTSTQLRKVELNNL